MRMVRLRTKRNEHENKGVIEEGNEATRKQAGRQGSKGTAMDLQSSIV